MTQIEAGTLKCLGVMSEDRMTLLPEVPTFKEEGHDLVVRAWAALVAPKGLDEESLTALRNAAKAAMESEECKEYFLSQGIEPLDYIGDDAYQVMADDYEMYKKVFETIEFAE